MGREASLGVVWRRKWVVVATFVVFLLTAGILSYTLPKVYSATATLLVSVPAETQSFDTVQASQAVARSYAEILDSASVAELAAAELDGALTENELQAATSFEVVAETQLLEITAESTDPGEAQRIAEVYAEAGIGYAEDRVGEGTEANLRLAVPPSLPEGPARPQPVLYMLVAALLGLAAGVALAFLRERLDHRLRTSDDVESRFDVPVLGRIPVRGSDKASEAAFQEAFRVLRMNLDFAAEHRLRSLAVVSGGDGEGKTTVAAQLALASAEVGLRPIAVEADLRKPALSRALGRGPDEPRQRGLTNYLVEAITIDQAIVEVERPNLRVMPAGPLPPSPSALLEARRGRTLVPDLLELGDIVFLDCPPLAVGADASVVSGWVDGVIVVVDLQRSTDVAVRDAFRQLETIEAPVLGVVLNRDREAEIAKYGDYHDGTAESNGSLRRSAQEGRDAVA